MIRTIGVPLRLGIGVLAVTSAYAASAQCSSGAPSAVRDLAVAASTSVTVTAATQAPTTGDVMRGGYMVTSGLDGIQ